MKTLISTDTSCLINYDVLNKFPISIFPLNVIIDGQEYLDGVNIKQDFLLNQMLKNKSIKTSTPPMGEVIKYFEEIFEKGYEYVIHFTISSKLSSMYSLFSQVSKNYFEDKIKIIDSYSVSTLMLSHVFYAYEEIQKVIQEFKPEVAALEAMFFLKRAMTMSHTIQTRGVIVLAMAQNNLDVFELICNVRNNFRRTERHGDIRRRHCKHYIRCSHHNRPSFYPGSCPK